MEQIELYTDGSSRGNPGPGGFGIVLKYKGISKELSKGFSSTTNNRMELLAVIIGIETIKKRDLPIHVFSDSKYVIDSITKGWIWNWVKTGFKGKKNKDLWLRYIKSSEGLNIKFTWVKGHNGHPENERCDALAVAAATGTNLGTDTGFERESDSATPLL